MDKTEETPVADPVTDEVRTILETGIGPEAAQGATEVAPPPVPDAVEEPSSDAPRTLEDVVRQWVSCHLANSPISRDVTSWNHLQNAIPHLVTALEGKKEEL